MRGVSPPGFQANSDHIPTDGIFRHPALYSVFLNAAGAKFYLADLFFGQSRLPAENFSYFAFSVDS